MTQRCNTLKGTYEGLVSSRKASLGFCQRASHSLQPWPRKFTIVRFSKLSLYFCLVWDGMHKLWCACDAHRATWGSLLSLSTMYALSIELKKSSLVESSFTNRLSCWPLKYNFFSYALTKDAKHFWELLKDVKGTNW